MPEVQSAMEGGGSSAAAKMASKLSSGSWITPELMQRIASEPILLAGMQQPKCMEALGELQKNPAAARAKYAGDPAITRFLMTFAGLLGEHFSQLGEAEKAASGGGQMLPPLPLPLPLLTLLHPLVVLLVVVVEVGALGSPLFPQSPPLQRQWPALQRQPRRGHYRRARTVR